MELIELYEKRNELEKELVEHWVNLDYKAHKDIQFKLYEVQVQIEKILFKQY